MVQKDANSVRGWSECPLFKLANLLFESLILKRGTEKPHRVHVTIYIEINYPILLLNPDQLIASRVLLRQD